MEYRELNGMVRLDLEEERAQLRDRMFECPLCTAVVIDPDGHSLWHDLEKNEPGIVSLDPNSFAKLFDRVAGDVYGQVIYDSRTSATGLLSVEVVDGVPVITVRDRATDEQVSSGPVAGVKRLRVLETTTDRSQWQSDSRRKRVPREIADLAPSP